MENEFFTKLITRILVMLLVAALLVLISVSCIKESEVISSTSTSYTSDSEKVIELLLLVSVNDLKSVSVTPVNAEISITDSTNVIQKQSIEAKVNRILLNKIPGRYFLTIIKKGYLNYTRVFTANDIQNSKDTMKIVLNSLLPGTMLYFPFFGNSEDWSPNNNNGVVNAAVLTTDCFGNENNSYYFDGSASYIQLPAANLMFDNYTYSFWALIEELPLESQYVLLSIGNFGGEQCIMAKNRISSGNGWTALGFNTDSAFIVFQEADLVINHWYHIVVTKSNTKLQLYIDDTLSAEKIYSIPRTTGYSYPVTGLVGTRYDKIFTFKGKIDEVLIFNRVLGTDEIHLLFNIIGKN